MIFTLHFPVIFCNFANARTLGVYLNIITVYSREILRECRNFRIIYL